MANEFKDIKELSLDPVRREKFGPWAVFMVIAVLPFLCMVAYLITGQIAESHEERVDEKFYTKLTNAAATKAQNIDLFLEESIAISKRVTNSRAVQGFSMDINNMEAGVVAEGALRQQYLYIQEILTTFVAQNELSGAHLINRRSEDYLRSSNAADLTENYSSYSRMVFTEKKPVYSPLRMNGVNMLMDVYVPIMALQTLSNNSQEQVKRVVGVLVMSMSIKDKLQEIMKPSINTLDGESLHVFQVDNGGLEMVRFGRDDEGIFAQNKDMKSNKGHEKTWDIFMLRDEGKFDLSKIPQFGSKTSLLPRSGEILMVKEKTRNIPLVIMGVLELRNAYADLIVQRKQIFIIGQLFAFLGFIVLLALWWKYQESRQRSITSLYQTFSEKVNAQRSLLLSVNDAVAEHIGLKYFDGKYVYVNKTFAKFFKLKEEDAIGKNDAALYGESAAKELAELDKRLLKEKTILFAEKSFIINDKRYHLEISKAPFLDGTNRFVGITTIVKDVTEMVMERQLREKAMKNSMRSMMRIMERHDTHLLRHANYLSRVVDGIAQHSHLKTEDKMILELSAKLSQVGKIYVPTEVLDQEGGEMNDQDTITYQTHIEDTAYILDTVDWGMPLVKTVYAMHEHLDGSGYPNSLTADEIPALSRILCVCDTFCHLTAPRRGMKIYTPEEAIKYMVNQKGCYDLSVIQMLAEMVSEDESLVVAS